ncbi:MAG: STAS/SEC14 domain-containing protein [Myxococcota bacterium]
MLTILDIGAPNVIGLEIDGKIEIDDINRVKTVVEEQLQNHDKLRIYVELNEIGGISLEALWEDLKLAFGNWSRWSHKAVVSDKEWLTGFTEVADKLFPSIHVKHFTWDQKEEARAWIRTEPV